MSSARLLYRLQHIEQEIESTRQAIAQMKEQQVESPALLTARETLATARRRLAAAQSQQKEREYELQRNVDKLNAAQEELYSGRVKNPKELAGLEADTKALMRRRDQLQDSVLDAMLEVDAARTEVAAAEIELAQLEAQWSADQHRIVQELEIAGARAEQIERDRAETEARLSAQDLQLYRELRRRKGSSPVARLRGGTCGRCGVSVPTQVVGQVKRDDELVFCPSCGRLLVDA